MVYLNDVLSKIKIPNSVVYILPPSIDELINRLATRPERIEEALMELELLTKPEYNQLIDHCLINKNLPDILTELDIILFNHKK